MIRLSKLTDYAIVLLTHMAQTGDKRWSARELSEVSNLPLPTVGKVLKSLSRFGILASARGATGGYALAKAASDIPITDVIAAIEGPISLTECGTNAPTLCDIEHCCPVRSNWQVITSTVRHALSQLSVSDMTAPMSKSKVAGLRVIKGGVG